MPQIVGQAARPHKLRQDGSHGYALGRRKVRFCFARESTVVQVGAITVGSGVSPEALGSAAVSLFGREGFRSQRQKAQRVDCV